MGDHGGTETYKHELAITIESRVSRKSLIAEITGDQARCCHLGNLILKRTYPEGACTRCSSWLVGVVLAL